MVRLERHFGAVTVAAAIAAFLTEHQLGPSSQKLTIECFESNQ
jgi:hypothetical protein